MTDEAILHLTEEQLTFFADRERAIGYREGHRAALAQRTWIGLTDDEISACSKGNMTRSGFARTVEAKLREKNT